MAQNIQIDKFAKSQIMAIAQQFSPQKQITDIKPFGSGNINDTFLVSLQAAADQSFILQRINTKVFHDPKLVMQNMRGYTNHVRDRLQNHPLERRWDIPKILPTQQGQDYWQTESGEFWRSLSFIAGSQSFDVMENMEQAREVGYALGTFHHLTSDLAPERLADTLEGFHITPRYLRQYQEVLSRAHFKRSPEVDYCLKFVSDRHSLAHILEDVKAAGKLPLRTMHGDPKVNNILFDRQTQLAVSVVDLDTVKSGLVHYDIGDCLRSGCNPAGEETEQWQDVQFDTELCQGILQGYLSTARSFLTEYDYAYIYDAVRVITFELGLRFFTDYLAGNIYFHVKYPEHNLLRSLVQFRLVESIESQQTVINKIIKDIR
ncbi:phosphotransferase enzyme family protein [Phormidium tenue]|jgi:Ser/Thr protein kinase RdoA (MazF antagonist)|uniref:Aminoglycoside phosphotransferase family protein n=1 Tax=Phormidium tenue FACHB-1050 TaxID=2692857 RepID=A0ABR8CAT1_9CYAN|nr:aminoglycoside phosphotransferase family protein [Phormidium tenue]MBD2317485.1 aminoglycoside phosphotransferase family protein [Phormidium tenue FACHB-1050]